LAKNSAAKLFAKYKHYDPAKEGFGDEQKWCRLFNMAMGFEEAQEFRAEQQRRGRWRDEYVILSAMSGVNVSEGSMWSEIKSAFRKATMNCHPDRTTQHGKPVAQAEEEFKELSAAYTLLSHVRGEK
jgi:DnaJ-domain-containing protein 1